MPHFISDDVLDAALNVLKNNVNLMVLCAGEPTSFANANTANGTGSGQKMAQVAMAPTDILIANGDVSGRKATFAAKNGISITAAGQASYVAYLDTVNSRILHYYPMPVARNFLVNDTVNFLAHDYESRDSIAE